MNSAFWASRSLAVALAAPLACGTAQAADPANLRIGTVREVALGDGLADFVLDLDKGQGVVIDLTPLEDAPELVQAAAITAAAVEAAEAEFAADIEAVEAEIAAHVEISEEDAIAADGASFDDAGLEDGSVPVMAYPAMRLLDAAGKCLRAVPEEEGCGRASARLSAVEGYPADGALRVAFYPVERGRFTVRLNRPGSQVSQRFELLARQRQIPSPPVEASIDICPVDEKASCGKAAKLGSDGRALFRFEADAAQWVQIDMTSSVIDSFVELHGPVEEGTLVEEAPLVASNDDGGGQLNAQLRSELVAGQTYGVVASSAGFGAPQGDFTLSVRAVLPPPPPPPPRPLEIGREYPVRFEGNEPVLPGGWRPYHLYSVEGEPGMTLTIDMASSEFDSFLEAGQSMAVLDVGNSQAGDFALLTSNDDGGGGRNARLLLRFEKKATVTLRASLPGAAGATGAYTIVARRTGEEAGQAASARQ